MDLSEAARERSQTFRGFIASRKSDVTAHAYQRGANKLELFLDDEGVDLATAKLGMLDDFVGWLIDHECAPSTIQLLVVGAKTYIAWRRKQGEQIPDFEDPEIPEITYKEPIVLDVESLRGFFVEAARLEDPVKTALMLLPLCGLRSEEMVRLTLKDVKLHDGWVYFFVMGKGRKKRIAPMLRQGNHLLRKYLTGWRSGVKSDFLFPSARVVGRPVSTRHLRGHMEDISRVLNRPEISPHTLRKTYATMLDQAGVSPFQIAQSLGHKKIETTQTHYVHHGVGGLVTGIQHVQVPLPETDS